EVVVGNTNIVGGANAPIRGAELEHLQAVPALAVLGVAKNGALVALEGARLRTRRIEGGNVEKRKARPVADAVRSFDDLDIAYGGRIELADDGVEIDAGWHEIAAVAVSRDLPDVVTTNTRVTNNGAAELVLNAEARFGLGKQPAHVG